MLLNLPTVALLSLLALPLVFTLTTRRPARKLRLAGTRLNPAQASAVDAAVARVVTAGPEYGGHTIQLPCRECGRRAVPPVDAVDSPPIPYERAGLVPLASGFAITAICSACSGPLISRVLDAEYAEDARRRGVIDGEPLEAELSDWLATL